MEIGQAKKIRGLIEPAAEALGFEIVRVRLYGGGDKTLQVMAERADGTMSIDDCAELSRAISPILDVADPIASEYRLEVSSPGIDRPLTRAKDFANWTGHEARIELDRALDGRKRFKGILRGLDGENALIELADTHESFALPISDIGEAKLVLTDELLKSAPPVKTEEFDEIEVEESEAEA